MGSLWRDSVHGAQIPAAGDEALDDHRSTALLMGIDPHRAIALVRVLAPLARVHLAADLPRGLEMAHRLQPEFIIVGAELGGYDVDVALRALSSHATLEAIPAIVLASPDDDRTRHSAMRGGALAWLPYTADADALLARVRLAVRMRTRTLARGSLPQATARG